MSEMLAARRHEIDGIPVWSREVPSPFTGSLMFRVGRADETLSTSGLSHMVEHLALFPFGKQVYGYNGFVDHLRTAFHAWGEPEQVVAFLRAVMTNLQSLPMDRLEHERRVLITEDDRTARGNVLSDRFGASGFGLVDYPQWGLRSIDEAGIVGWARERFTRPNCVALFSGPVPDGFAVDLLDGVPAELPPPDPIAALTTPSHVHTSGGPIGVSMIVDREPPIYLSIRILEDRAMEALRRDLGVSYQVGSGWLPIGPAHAHTIVEADVAKEQGGVVARELVDVVNRFLDEGPTADELAHVVEQFEIMLQQPMWGFGELDAAAMDELTGRPHREPAELLDQMRRVAPEEAAEAFRQSVQTAILSLPAEVDSPPGRFDAESVTFRDPPLSSTLVYEPYVPDSARSRLSVSDSAISLATDDGNIAIRFDDAVVLLRAGDGTHSIVRSDGAFITLNANRYVRALALVEHLADALQERIVDVDEFERWRTLHALVDERGIDRRAFWNELRVLSGTLEGSERVRDVTIGSVERVGALAITDRRVLHLSATDGNEYVTVWPLDTVERLDATARLGSGRLTIVADGAGVVVSGIRPRDAAFRFAALFPALKAERSQGSSEDSNAEDARETSGDRP